MMLFKPTSHYYKMRDNNKAIQPKSVYGNDFSLAHNSKSQLPMENKVKRLSASYSSDFKRDSQFSSSASKLRPEIPPPKLIDIFKRKVSRVEPPPKFIRDSMDVSDIDGAKPRLMYINKNCKDIMKYRDIEGAFARKSLFTDTSSTNLNTKSSYAKFIEVRALQNMVKQRMKNMKERKRYASHKFSIDKTNNHVKSFSKNINEFDMKIKNREKEKFLETNRLSREGSQIHTSIGRTRDNSAKLVYKNMNSRERIKANYKPEESYHSRFSKKLKELSNSARSQKYYTDIQSINQKQTTSRNHHFGESKNLDLSEVRNAYETKNNSDVSQIDIGDSRLVKDKNLRPIKFSLDQINPIIRRLNARKNSKTLKNV